MRSSRIEWPTVGVAAAIVGGFGAVLVWHDRLPIAATLVALAVLGGWYNSLQHEVIHGHPTPWRRVNSALVIVPLGLVVPFAEYRDIHLAHHREPELTDPALDPESFYVSAETWRRSGAPRRAVLHVHEHARRSARARTVRLRSASLALFAPTGRHPSRRSAGSSATSPG